MEIFDRRVDWLLASAPVGILVFLFYGAYAGLSSICLVTAIIFFKPLGTVLETPRSRLAVAAGLVLLLSPIFRLMFATEFCTDAPYSIDKVLDHVPTDGSALQGDILGAMKQMALEQCKANVWNWVGSYGGTGYIRDFGYTILGGVLFALGLKWRKK